MKMADEAFVVTKDSTMKRVAVPGLDTDMTNHAKLKAQLDAAK